MGNELTNDKESDKEQDIENEEIKYGLISKKCKEKSNNDTYIISPGIKFSDEDKNIEYNIYLEFLMGIIIIIYQNIYLRIFKNFSKKK